MKNFNLFRENRFIYKTSSPETGKNHPSEVQGQNQNQEVPSRLLSINTNQPTPDDIKEASNFLGAELQNANFRTPDAFLKTLDGKVTFKAADLINDAKGVKESFQKLSALANSRGGLFYTIMNHTPTNKEVRVYYDTSNGQKFNFRMNGCSNNSKLVGESSENPSIHIGFGNKLSLPLTGLTHDEAIKQLDSIPNDRIPSEVIKMPEREVNVDSFNINGKTILRSQSGGSSLTYNQETKQFGIGGGWNPSAEIFQDSGKKTIIIREGDASFHKYYEITLIDTNDQKSAIGYQVKNIEYSEVEKKLNQANS